MHFRLVRRTFVELLVPAAPLPDRVDADGAETDPREDQTEANARAIAAAETFRATARRQKALGSLPLKTEPGPPMTLGNAVAAKVRLIVWCRDCGHQVEPVPAEQAQHYGVETAVLDWRGRLVCSKCGSREIDMVATGTRR